MIHALLKVKLWLHRHAPRWVQTCYHWFYEAVKAE